MKPSALRILNYLRANGSITGHDALVHCGTTELRSRISELRKEGYWIAAEWETSKNAFGDEVRYKRYHLFMEARNGKS